MSPPREQCDRGPTRGHALPSNSTPMSSGRARPSLGPNHSVTSCVKPVSRAAFLLPSCSHNHALVSRAHADLYLRVCFPHAIPSCPTASAEAQTPDFLNESTQRHAGMGAFKMTLQKPGTHIHTCIHTYMHAHRHAQTCTDIQLKDCLTEGKRGGKYFVSL